MREIYKLTRILKQYFNINFARITFIARMILSLIKVRTVCLSEVATGFAGKAKAGSNEKRIQRFLKDFPLDIEAIARFTASKLPECQWILTMDRTYWEFGRLKINILMLAVVYKGVAIPLVWKFLGEPDSGKKGNSDTGERIELISRFIRLFGVGSIRALCAVNSSAAIGSGGSDIRASLSASESGKISISRIPQVLRNKAVLCSAI